MYLKYLPFEVEVEGWGLGVRVMPVVRVRVGVGTDRGNTPGYTTGREKHVL